MPKLRLRRTILFVRDIALLARFYRDVLGLTVRNGSAREGWVDFGPLALHRGTPRPGSTKIAFYVSNVPRSCADLMARGAKFGKVKDFGDLVLCDGEDPEGNPIQLSNRR